MKHTIVVIMVISFACLSHAQDDGASTAALKNSGPSDAKVFAHDGVWKPAAAVLGDMPFPDKVLSTITLKLAGENYEVTVGRNPGSDKGTCTLDTTTNPKRMTIKGTEGPNRGKTIPAIYEMKDADSMPVCYDLSGKDFPTEFKAPKGTLLYLVDYRRQPAGETGMSHKVLFEKMVGKWEGNCRTWFEPGKLADESHVSGEFTQVLGGRFLRHAYEGTIQGKPRHGEDLLAFNTVRKVFQSSWVDDFHMNYAIMVSEGPATERGFSVRGDYDVGGDHPKWGWRTEFELIDDDHLTITAYNIEPDGTEAKAVETVYRRVGKADGGQQ